VKTKRCSKCGEVKPVSEFYKQKGCKYGSSHCKECNKEYWKRNIEHYREIKKEYYKNHREIIIKRVAQWRIDNPEKKILQRKKEYAANRKEFIKRAIEWNKNNIEKRREISRNSARKLRLENPEKLSEYRRKLRKKQSKKLSYILNNRMRSSIYNSLKLNKNGWHWEILVGFTLRDLKIHLENLFKDGMSWQNIGKWQIDHIKPISSFNFTSYEDKEFKECWSLDNLQPLWAEDNLSKGNRYIG